MMRVRILAVICLDPVVSLLRQQHIAGRKLSAKRLSADDPRLFVRSEAAAEMPAVMYQTDKLRVEVFPRPIQPGQLAEVCVLRADIVARIVTGESEIRLSLPPDMERIIHGIGRHPVRLVGRYYDLDLIHCTVRLHR